MTVETWIKLGVVLTLTVGSGYSAWTSLRRFRQADAIEQAPRFQESSSSQGPVTVEGTVYGPAGGHSLESEFGGTPCVAYASEVTKQRSATPGEDVNRSPRVTIDTDREEEAIPFTVDADGQRIHLDGRDAHVDWPSFDYEHLSEGEVLRNRSGFRAILGLLLRLGGGNDRRRLYREACLRPGDRIHVVGTPRDGADGTDLTFENGGGAPLVVSANEPVAVANWFRQRAKSKLLWTVLLLGAGVFAALLWTGVV